MRPHHWFVAAFVAITAAVVSTATAVAQVPTGLQNGDFERGAVGAVPADWILPPRCAEHGYELAVVGDGAFAGKHAARLRSAAKVEADHFGNCMQLVDAVPLRGKRVRLGAAVRVIGAEASAQMWLRVDRRDDRAGFFDNMDARPIRGDTWQRVEIVGLVAFDADAIALGVMLLGSGTILVDDVTLAVVDDATPTTAPAALDGCPGLAVVLHEAEGQAMRDADATTLRFPLPLAYRDQTPVTFRLAVEPAAVVGSATIESGPGENRVLALELRDLEGRQKVSVRYESVILVAPSDFGGVPARAAFPNEWPEAARPWLQASWCCDSDDARIKGFAKECRAGDAEVMTVIANVQQKSRTIVAAAEGQATDLRAVTALDHQGSCTSNANLTAAMLRACNVPARVLAGYPLWSGPLQTHYIVEAFVPGYGWYPVESTLCRAPWPNYEQLAVRIIPIEHEAEALAGRRYNIAGAVPYLSMTEYPARQPIALLGTLGRFCDHEARMLRFVDATPAEWQKAQDWARQRWEKWLAAPLELRDGKLEFGPARDSIGATTLAELRTELH